jgi:hypothetical protein
MAEEEKQMPESIAKMIPLLNAAYDEIVAHVKTNRPKLISTPSIVDPKVSSMHMEHPDCVITSPVHKEEDIGLYYGKEAQVRTATKLMRLMRDGYDNENYLDIRFENTEIGWHDKETHETLPRGDKHHAYAVPRREIMLDKTKNEASVECRDFSTNFARVSVNRKPYSDSTETFTGVDWTGKDSSIQNKIGHTNKKEYNTYYHQKFDSMNQEEAYGLVEKMLWQWQGRWKNLQKKLGLTLIWVFKTWESKAAAKTNSDFKSDLTGRFFVVLTFRLNAYTIIG